MRTSHCCLEVTGPEADHHFDLAWSLVGVGKRRWQVQLEMGFWELVESEGNKMIYIHSLIYSPSQPFIQ